MEFLLLIPACLLAFLLWDEKRSHARERKELIDRIQFPEVKAHEAFTPTRERQHVGFDDDEAAVKASNG